MVRSTRARKRLRVTTYTNFAKYKVEDITELETRIGARNKVCPLTIPGLRADDGESDGAIGEDGRWWSSERTSGCACEQRREK